MTDPEQLALAWSAPAGRAARDEAIARVDEHADLDWKQIAGRAVRAVCEQLDEFTTDDIWRCLESDPDADTHEHRAMGAVMLRARRAGWCAPTGRVRQSDRVVAHRGPKAIWKSLL
jgi:hypothetical protein